MTPEERQIIQTIGQSLLLRCTSATPRALLYGFLMPVAIILAYQHPTKTWRSKCQLAVIWLGIVTLNAVLLLSNIATPIIIFRIFQDNTTPQHLYYTNASLTTLDVTLNWCTCVPPVINDAFIIWRAWVVFQRRSWALCLSITLCLCTFVGTLVFVSIFSNRHIYMTAVQTNNEVFDVLNITTAFLSFLTNIVATSFIGWTLWEYRKCMKTLQTYIVHKECQLFKPWHILCLLTDAGALYAILQLLFVVMCLVIHPNKHAAIITGNVISSIYASISAIYPALTIALVHGPFSILYIHDTVQSLPP